MLCYVCMKLVKKKGSYLNKHEEPPLPSLPHVLADGPEVPEEHRAAAQ